MTRIEQIEIEVKEIALKLAHYERHPERGYKMAIDDIHYLMDLVQTLLKEYYSLKEGRDEG